VESGSNKVLEFIEKGESAEDHIRGCRNAAEAELSVSIYVMPGLGGKHLSVEHAHETAYVADYETRTTLSEVIETPVIRTIRDGLVIRMTPIVANGEISLDIELTRSNL